MTCDVILLMCEQLGCTFSRLTSDTLCYSCGFQAEQQVSAFIRHLMLRHEHRVHIEAWLIDPLKRLPSSLGLCPRVVGSFTVIESQSQFSRLDTAARWAWKASEWTRRGSDQSTQLLDSYWSVTFNPSIKLYLLSHELCGFFFQNPFKSSALGL